MEKYKQVDILQHNLLDIFKDDINIAFEKSFKTQTPLNHNLIIEVLENCDDAGINNFFTLEIDYAYACDHDCNCYGEYDCGCGNHENHKNKIKSLIKRNKNILDEYIANSLSIN